eukprot:6412255-Amphidinium_carterae.2
MEHPAKDAVPWLLDACCSREVDKLLYTSAHELYRRQAIADNFGAQDPAKKKDRCACNFCLCELQRGGCTALAFGRSIRPIVCHCGCPPM